MAAITVLMALALTGGCGRSSTPGSVRTGTTSGTTTTTTEEPGMDTITVTGAVTAGPVRNVDRPGAPNTVPVTVGSVVATTEAGAEVGRAAISATGTYRLELVPGHYLLTPTGTGVLRCPASAIDVPATGGALTHDLACDTGLR